MLTLCVALSTLTLICIFGAIIDPANRQDRNQ